ncbi:MAG: hypothetical protein JSR90_21455 [Proteobacteria bacterium]|nr:hypothetical protein [Pseudomonadota bacterium]
MTSEQAYAAAYYFLDKLYFRDRPVHLGSLLGSMSLLADGAPVDDAIVKDWRDAVQFALAGSKATSLTDSQAYAAMYRFVEQLRVAIESEELGRLLQELATRPDGLPADPVLAALWDEAVQYALAGGEAGRLTFGPPQQERAAPSSEVRRGRVGSAPITSHSRFSSKGSAGARLALLGLTMRDDLGMKGRLRRRPA